MKTDLIRVFVGTVVGVGLSITCYPQNGKIKAAGGDKYVISAKAGGVNEIDGKVAVFRVNGTSGYLLKGDEINIGDHVSTGDDGKAEVLLNPGSYMRVGQGTSFEFLTTSLDDLRLKMKSGSAVFEVIADDDFRVTILMPRTAMALTRSGVYRIDILGDGSSKVSVWKGKVFVGAKSKTEVKSGHSATVVGISADIQKFDKDDRDGLTLWSKDRAKDLAKVNASLQQKAMRNTLLNSFNRGWNLYDSFGLWVYSPSRSNWCFLPFGYGWGSPYGYTYNFDLWNVRMPGTIFYQPRTNLPSSSGAAAAANSPAVTSNNERANQLYTPPFMRIQNSPRASDDPAVGGSRVYDNPGRSASPFPSSTGASTQSAPVSAPRSEPATAPAERRAPAFSKGHPDN